MKLIISSYKALSRFFLILFGFTVLAIGICMIILPGPAVLVIPAGLAILATEYIWARKLLKKVKLGYSNIQKAATDYFSKE